MVVVVVMGVDVPNYSLSCLFLRLWSLSGCDNNVGQMGKICSDIEIGFYHCDIKSSFNHILRNSLIQLTSCGGIMHRRLVTKS